MSLTITVILLLQDKRYTWEAACVIKMRALSIGEVGQEKEILVQCSFLKPKLFILFAIAIKEVSLCTVIT